MSTEFNNLLKICNTYVKFYCVSKYYIYIYIYGI